MQFPHCIFCGEKTSWGQVEVPTPGEQRATPEETAAIRKHVLALLKCLEDQATDENQVWLYALGKSLLRLGRANAAAEALFRLLDLAPHNSAACLELGRALLAGGNSSIAAQILRRGLRLAHDQRDEITLCQIDDLLDRADRDSAALAAPDRRGVADPNDWLQIGPNAPADPPKRIALHVAVLRAEDVGEGDYVALNVSEGGICLRSMRQERVGGFVALRFTLVQEELDAYARVVWCRPEAELDGKAAGYRVGLRWIAPDAKLREDIRRYDALFCEGS
jgi:tetratricopeptide (TPR) repeat protein